MVWQVLDSAWRGSRILRDVWVADFACACLVFCFVVRLMVWGFSSFPGLPEHLPIGGSPFPELYLWPLLGSYALE